MELLIAEYSNFEYSHLINWLIEFGLYRYSPTGYTHRWWCCQRAKVVGKCKCQRKLLIVSAFAFQLPFLAAWPRTKSQRRKKNIKPKAVRKKRGEKNQKKCEKWQVEKGIRPIPFPKAAHCCLRLFGYFFLASQPVSHPSHPAFQPASQAAHVVPAFLTLPWSP